MLDSHTKDSVPLNEKTQYVFCMGDFFNFSIIFIICRYGGDGNTYYEIFNCLPIGNNERIIGLYLNTTRWSKDGRIDGQMDG